MGELRKDPITPRWVIVAQEREGFPESDFSDVRRNEEETCPFCPGHEYMTPPELFAFRKPGTEPDTPHWDLRLIPNKHPILTTKSLIRACEGMYDKISGTGTHEVLIETRKHGIDISSLNKEQIEKILWIYKDRYISLKKDSSLRYMLIFKNSGYSAGATINHAHSQIIGLPVIPKRVFEELVGAEKYYNYKERCIFCDIVHYETDSDERVAFESKYFIAIAPFASRFPFELWILPREHITDCGAFSSRHISDLAFVLKNVLYRIQATLGRPGYNFVVHNAPFNCFKFQMVKYYFHFHIEIIPRLIKSSGFETGTGFYINPTSPEFAARFIKSAKV